MCKVKNGSQVCNLQDLQNLVTSVINCQFLPFNKRVIMEMVAENLTGSVYVGQEDGRRQVESMINQTINVFERCNIIKYHNGNYFFR